MIVSLIAAISSNGVIGKAGGGIPWHLPRDTAHFREYTAGKWMVVGRRTYSEMIGWFGDRIPIVMTGSTDRYSESSVKTAKSIESAIELAKSNQAGELVVSGGGQVYEAAIPWVDKMIITRVGLDLPIENGIVLFPNIDWQQWHLDSSQDWMADKDNAYSMKMEIWQKQ